ncbi:MAG TPA: SDR family oxidoreductase, partial [Casimicrobiaceae bacterium]|nr:SDR family oxidoreductase [Casimicrobiaceae bacterium]
MAQPPKVFLTGASSGLGEALAKRYAKDGATLGLVARRADARRAWADAEGFDAASVAVHAADVRDVDAIVAAGRACIAAQGLPDVVVANAGISVGFDTAEVDDLDVMRRIYETNNVGMAATFHPFVRAMCERRRGTLVGIGSVAGVRGLPGHGAYCSSKAAVMAYCESLRGECRPYGVRVVTLGPGYVDTPLTRFDRHSKPFMLTPDEFARRAVREIARGTSYAVIPWQMAIVARL